MTSTSLQGVTILTNNHHSRCLEKLESHTTVFLPPSGYRVRLRHIRNGLELPPVTGDNNYDPNYQEYRRFQSLVHVHRVSIVKHFTLSLHTALSS